MKKSDNITIRSLVLGALFSGAFALLTVILENRYNMLPTANQLPLFPFVMLALFVLLLNRCCGCCASSGRCHDRRC